MYNLGEVKCKGGKKMWKKILASFFICGTLLAISSVGYATGGTDNFITEKETQINIDKKEVKTDENTEDKNVEEDKEKEEVVEGNKEEEEIEKKEEEDLSKYQLINPEDRSYTSKEKVAFINGKAPSGTSITIEVYGTTDLTRKNFNLSKLPTEEDYIEIFSETIEAGNMGFFDKQLDLVTGINRIIVNFNVEAVPSQEIIIFVEHKKAVTNNEVKITDIISLIE